MQTASRKMGEFLVDRKVLSKDDLEQALRKEADSGVPLTKILAAEGLVSERDLAAGVANQLGIPFWDPSTTPVSPLVEGIVPAELATRQRVICVGVDGDALLVATANPLEEETLATISKVTGWRAKACLATGADIDAALQATYGPTTDAAGGPDAVAVAVSRPLHVNQILSKVVDARGSDLHLTAGRPPMARIDGALVPVEGFEELNRTKVRDLVDEILSQRLRERFENNLELDTAHVVPDVGRFRLNVYQQRDSVGAVFRTIPFEILSRTAGHAAVGTSVCRAPRGASCW